jgi:tetratricopeptide (TPR) repeat protein
MARSKKASTMVDPRVVEALGRLGRGDRLGAKALLDAAHRDKPNRAEPHYGLALVAIRGGAHDEGLAHLRRAIELDGRVADYHARLASLLAERWELDEAARAIERARWLEPSKADHHSQAASILERLGRAADAARAADRALALDPNDGRARVIRVRLAVREGALDDQPVEAWRTELRAIAEGPGNPIMRAMAWETLGDLCEALGAYGEAFEAFVETNRADTLWQPIPSEDERAHYLDWTGRVAASLTREKLERWAALVPDDGLPSPALLVGFPRSGTTMTERALDAHPAVASLEERPTFRALVRRMMEMHASDTDRIEEVNERLTPDEIAELRRYYWERAGAELGAPPDPGVLLLDKLPIRIAQLGLVNRVFPDARVVVALRDPRDVCLSNLRQRFRMSPTMSFSLTLENTARLYEHVMGIWLDTRELYTLPWLEIRYEDVVSDFEGHMRRVVEFLGLPWDDAVLSFHERKGSRVANTPSYHAVRKRVNTRAVGRWRNYREGLAPIVPRLQRFLDAFGYAND